MKSDHLSVRYCNSPFRDTLPHYSARHTSAGALVKEAHLVFKALSQGMSIPQVRTAVLNGSLIPKKSFETRRTIWRALHRRYFANMPPWVVTELAKAAAAGNPSTPRFLSLLYLHFALRDRLTFDFVTGPLWDKWYNGLTHVNRGEVLIFLDAAGEKYPEIKRWRESSRNKVASNVLSSLRDFGLLRGVQQKHIQKPPVPIETAYHLFLILTAEGLKGRTVLEAPAWKLFLWSESDVGVAFLELSQQGRLRYERAGQTVILEAKEFPVDWR
ncbi:MAG: DUF1819 family protein [Firmicutes bacterium]|nr:DUF1819 family protein [Bacillota bacterium]